MNYKEKLKDITTFIFDVDGVLTDGKVYLLKEEVVRALNSKDGYALQYASKNNYQLFIITGGYSEDLKKRLIDLGINDVFLRSNNKIDVYNGIKDKYGNNNVSQMLTFGRLQGRSAMKEVLRVNDACGFAEMNEITKYIPDEAAISDQLSQMDEEDRSIIRWTLQNRADDLMDYCHIDDEGRLQGDFAEYFQQAIDIEGTFKTQGKHAAGVVISADPLFKVCPMVNQKSGGEKIAGLEMNDLEALGHVKFDLLGLNLLDKLMYIKELINES